MGNAAKPPEIVDAHADRSRGTLREPLSRSLVAGMGNGPRARVRYTVRRHDTNAYVVTAQGTERIGAIWTENHTWDPGD